MCHTNAPACSHDIGTAGGGGFGSGAVVVGGGGGGAVVVGAGGAVVVAGGGAARCGFELGQRTMAMPVIASRPAPARKKAFGVI